MSGAELCSYDIFIPIKKKPHRGNLSGILLRKGEEQEARSWYLGPDSPCLSTCLALGTQTAKSTFGWVRLQFCVGLLRGSRKDSTGCPQHIPSPVPLVQLLTILLTLWHRHWDRAEHPGLLFLPLLSLPRYFSQTLLWLQPLVSCLLPG